MNLYKVEYYEDLGGNNSYLPGHVTMQASNPEEARQLVAISSYNACKLYVGPAHVLDGFEVISIKQPKD